MQITATNQTSRPVLITLNSGSTLHLAPHAQSTPLHKVEINNNAMVTKLLHRHVITVQEVSAAAQPETADTTGQGEGEAAGKQPPQPAPKKTSS